MWSQPKLIAAFKRVAEELVATVERKNADYSDGGDALSNFKLIELVTAGRISAEDGIIVRMTDKLARVSNLVTRDPQVLDESFEDTAYDLAAYSILLGLLRRSRTEPDEVWAEPAPPQEPPAMPMEPTAFERLKAMFAKQLKAAQDAQNVYAPPLAAQ